MSKQQKNSAFVKMLKEFPKVFGRVSFRERLMLRTAFNYVVEEIIVDLEKENSDLKERYNKVDIIGYDALKNLTKAKEIIKELLSCCRNYPQENADKMKQAEQFLQENEDDLKEGCPDVLCEDCTKEDCTVRKLGLVPNKEIEK